MIIKIMCMHGFLKRKILPLSIVVLVLLQIVLVLFSWIVSLTMPSFSVRPILSGEGMRWFMGRFVDNMLSPLLVWLILLSIAYGVFRHSGLLDVIIMVCRGRNLPLRCRRALFAAFALFVVMCLIVFLLSFVPHAVLLGVSGSLYPSAFSASVVPVLTLMLVVISLAYAVVGGVYSSLSDIFRGLYVGVVVFAPLFPLYVLVMQLYIVSGLMFLSFRLSTCRSATYARVFQIVAYSSAPMLLCVVPVLGNLAGLIWCLASIVIGCRAAFRLSWAQTIVGCLPTGLLLAMLLQQTLSMLSSF